MFIIEIEKFLWSEGVHSNHSFENKYENKYLIAAICAYILPRMSMGIIA